MSSPREREPTVFDLQDSEIGAVDPEPAEEAPDEAHLDDLGGDGSVELAGDDPGELPADGSAELDESTESAESAPPADPQDGEETTDPNDDAAADEPTGLLTPEDYLAELCGLHQVVLVGDVAGVAEHVSTIAGALRSIHSAGITNFAWEFTNSRAQDRLDQLVMAATWDDRLCADLFVDLLGVGFSYQEYADVLHAAWELNASLSPDATPLRVVGLGIPSYVEDPDLLDGRSAGELELRNWWLGGHYRDITAFHMANVLTSQVLRKGERVLVYCEAPRTVTRLIEWINGSPTITLGQLLHRWMGEGVQRVVFHGAIDDGEAIERVEALIDAAPEDVGTLGIDLELSTLGNVGVTSVVGSTDGEQTTFRLRDLADGYIFVAPRESWTPCGLIPDLITPANFVDIEARYRALDPRDDRYTLDDLERVRHDGVAALPAGWPSLPEPDEPEEKKRRFRRR